MPSVSTPSPATPTEMPLVDRARRAEELVRSHPRLAVSQAEAVGREARVAGDLLAEAMVERTLGVAARQLGDIGAARAHLQAAVTLGRRAGDRPAEGRARMSLAAVLLLGGRSSEALRETERAESLLVGADLARLMAQRALIFQRLGRVDEAQIGYSAALTTLAELGPEGDFDRATILRNRAILLTYDRDLVGADADLAQAEALYEAAGAAVAVAETRHNRGFVSAQRGDLAAALRWYEVAGTEFERLGVRQPAALIDRCQALLAVGLAVEAHETARAAAHQFEADDNALDLAEARLILSEAAMLAGEGGEAMEVVALARLAFVHQGRPSWAALARYQFLRASWYSGLQPTSVSEVRAAARELEACGWIGPAADARVIAARVALEAGDQRAADDDLARVAPHRLKGPADLRARAWHAEALSRLGRGNRRGALGALRHGLVVLEEQQAGLGAPELRAHAAGAAVELVTLGLGLALESRRPVSVLAWAERSRATALRAAPVRAPDDGRLAELLLSLRAVVAEATEAVHSGRPSADLRREQARIEAAIHRRARTVAGPGLGAPFRPPAVDALAEALGDQALLEYVAFAGDMWVVTVIGGRLRLRRLGPLADVRDEIGQLSFAQERLARQADRPVDPQLAAAASQALAFAAGRLEDLLLAPLRAGLGDRDLVVVPTGVLHALPWSVLRACHDRAVTVAPSAAHWIEGASRHRSPLLSATLVAGPGVASAESEVAAVASLYERPISLVDDRATVAGALAALAQSDVGHLAAHGIFRSDNPLFSSVELADGPLTVYDLQALSRVPSTIVLSTCDGARAAVTSGDELIGLAATLLTLGVTTVVASTVSVPDASTGALMVEFHRELRTSPPATALSRAQSTCRGRIGGDADRALTSAAVGAFSCFGAG